ncbi:ParA family protein [Alphaproteobacteria bacterium LSUCC0684]
MIANVKGGVGKSTLTCYLADYLRMRKPRLSMTVIDTDLQGSSYESLSPVFPAGKVKHLPISGRYDAVNVMTLDTLMRSELSYSNHVMLLDTSAGKPETLHQAMMMCKCLLVPVSLSWTDIRPTSDFIREIQELKDNAGSLTPHIIVVPNRLAPQQRNLNYLAKALTDLDVVIAPGLSELSVIKHKSEQFSGLIGTHGTRFFEEFERFGQFICDYVLTGKLDEIYSDTNVVPLRG